MRCEECNYYFPYHETRGQCRREPPKITLFEGETKDDGYYFGCFPDVNHSWWCGEFIPKKNIKE